MVLVACRDRELQINQSFGTHSLGKGTAMIRSDATDGPFLHPSTLFRRANPPMGGKRRKQIIFE